MPTNYGYIKVINRDLKRMLYQIKIPDFAYHLFYSSFEIQKGGNDKIMFVKDTKKLI